MPLNMLISWYGMGWYDRLPHNKWLFSTKENLFIFKYFLIFHNRDINLKFDFNRLL